jgi:type IV pilus assembly protein PilB
MSEKKKLGQILVDSGAISLKDLETFLKEQEDLKDERGYQTKLGTLLLEHKLVDEETLALAFAEQQGVEYKDLSQFKADVSILEKIPISILQEFKFIPISLDSEKLVIAIHDPIDTFLFDLLYKALGIQIEYCSSTRTSIDFKRKEAMRSLEESGRVNDEFHIDFEQYRLIVQQEKKKDKVDEVLSKPEVSTRNSLDNDSLEDMCRHFLKATKYTSLRFSFLSDEQVIVSAHSEHGQVYYGHLNFDSYQSLYVRVKNMTDFKEQDIHYISQAYFDLPFSEEEFHTFQVTFFPTNYGVEMHLSEYPFDGRNLSISRLGLLPAELKKMQDHDWSSRGMLILGAGNSGRSTSFQAVIHDQKLSGMSKVLLEEKPGPRFSHATQVLLDSERGQLQSLPYLATSGSIEMIGIDGLVPQELSTVLRTVRNRPFVVTCTSSYPVVPFLTGMEKQGIGLGFLLSSFEFILFQKLVPELCPYCIQPHIPKPDEIAKYRIKPESLKKPVFSYSGGCDYCQNTGSAGYTLIYEFLHVTPQVKKLLQEMPISNELAVQLLKCGALTSLNNVAKEKLYQGLISMQTYVQILHKKI